MRYLILAAALLVPTLAKANDPPPIQQHMLLPGMTDEPGVTFHCQMGISAGFITPGDIVVTDVVTKAVLFSLPAGGSVATDQCINAPDGHAVDVLAPAPGSVFRPISGDAK